VSQILPPALTELIEAFGLLPGVGPRTAERYAYYLLRHSSDTPQKLAAALTDLRSGIGYCKKTFALTPAGQDLSDLYTDPRRDKTVVAVVAEPFDLVALERTGQFNGTYHVLGGLVSPIDGIGPDQLHIAELVARIDEDNVTEIILATNASVEGESTALYIQQQIGDRNVTISRLARGLPIGVDLEYADQITLGRALEGRQAL
jgi:recombination protein RecR